MYTLAVIFFILSIVASVFGFTGIVPRAARMGKTLFYVFVVLFLIFLVLELLAGWGAF